jgi:hypothetical protein
MLRRLSVVTQERIVVVSVSEKNSWRRELRMRGKKHKKNKREKNIKFLFTSVTSLVKESESLSKQFNSRLSPAKLDIHADSILISFSFCYFLLLCLRVWYVSAERTAVVHWPVIDSLVTLFSQWVSVLHSFWLLSVDSSCDAVATSCSDFNSIYLLLEVVDCFFTLPILRSFLEVCVEEWKLSASNNTDGKKEPFSRHLWGSNKRAAKTAVEKKRRKRSLGVLLVVCSFDFNPILCLTQILFLFAGSFKKDLSPRNFLFLLEIIFGCILSSVSHITQERLQTRYDGFSGSFLSWFLRKHVSLSLVSDSRLLILCCLDFKEQKWRWTTRKWTRSLKLPVSVFSVRQVFREPFCLSICESRTIWVLLFWRWQWRKRTRETVKQLEVSSLTLKVRMTRQ